MNDISINRLPLEEGLGFPPYDDSTGADRARGASPLVIKYLRVAKRWRWLILATIIASLIAGAVITLLTTPKYTAVATVEIQRENYRIVDVDGVEPKTQSADGEFYQTQYGLLRSESLAQRVARRLKLQDSAEFFDMNGVPAVAEEIRTGGARAASPAAKEERVRRAGSILLDGLDVSPERTSRLVKIGFTSPDPALSAKIVDAWMREFIDATLARKYEATSYARHFLEERLEQLRQKLQESERLLVAYATQTGIVNLPTTTSSNNGPEGSVTERPLVAENLAAINRELNDAIAARVLAESRLRSAGGTTREGLDNPAITGLRQRRAEVAADYAKMLVQYEPSYPQARALQSQLEQLDRAISREEGRVGATLREAYQAAAAREAALTRRVATLRGEMMDLRTRSIQYNIYQREVDTNRQLYDGLLQRYKEIGVAGGVGVNNISVVDPAQVPKTPSSPKLVQNMLLALFFGVALGAGLALALDQIDEAISDPTDAERALGMPLLGAIPKVADEEPRADLNDPKSALFEAYLSAQTSLAFTTDHGVPKSLMVTSTRPAEGKSISTYALARSLARTGNRVLLIDADMRSPSLHHLVGCPNNIGLSNYLAGSGNLSEMIRPDAVAGVDLMTAGPQPPNAAELLTGGRLSMLLAELSANYDHVLFDGPPVMGLADAPLIASRVEGTVFVIQSHATRKTVARVAIGRLREARARMLGALLTKFEARRADYGYGYEYGYGYGERATKDA